MYRGDHPGVETTNILYVTKDGNDNNSGLLEGDAKATIGGAAAVALDGDTIYVRPGVYFENNPVGLRTDVSISGQDLRLVTIVPNNVNDDIFHVRRGCLVENVNFAASNFGVLHEGCGCLAFHQYKRILMLVMQQQQEVDISDQVLQ